MEPKNPNSSIDNEVEAFANLLTDHLTVIQKISEDAVLEMSKDLKRIKQELSNIAAKAPDAVDLDQQVEQLSELQAALQFQDVIRQQIDAVKVGLEILAKTHPPLQETDKRWIHSQLEVLERAYVTRDQWQVHRKYFNNGTEHLSESFTFF